MKSPTLGLAISTLAFAGSSIYLWNQLVEQRARAEEVMELTHRLNSRIAELEQAREQVARMRLATENGMNAVPPTAANPGAVPQAAVSTDQAHAAQAGFQMPRPELSPSYQKMMRAQFRANNRRAHAELGAYLGLSEEDANRLIDLISDQQLAMNTRSAEPLPTNATDMRERWEQLQRDHQKQIVDLIGPAKAEEFRKYQETMPARGEVEMIARQLEGSDAPLKDDQRKQLIALIADERGRVPMPLYDSNTDPEAYTKLANDWQSDYEQRVNAQARAILDNEQYNAYSDYLQWQKEMREQFAVSRRMMSLPGAGPRGNVVYATPATVGVAISAAPLPPPEPEKKN